MKRCTQCWREKPIDQFEGKRGRLVRWCNSCRKRYRTAPKTIEERVAERYIHGRRGLRMAGKLRIHLIPKSGNHKLGPIPASMSSAETCPTSCSFFGQGCYAEFHYSRLFWSQVPKRGVSWKKFLASVAALPEGQLWRHNVAGDLAGQDEDVDIAALGELVSANRGRRGFTFTHKPVLGRGRAKVRAAIRRANRGGFTVNLSADSLDHADKLAALGIAPVAVVLPSDTPDDGVRTPQGRRVVVCPSQTRGRPCSECELCFQQERAIVGFRAHGQLQNHVSQLVQLRRKGRAA